MEQDLARIEQFLDALWLERNLDGKYIKRVSSRFIDGRCVVASSTEKRLRRRRLMIYKRCWLNGWRADTKRPVPHAC